MERIKLNTMSKCKYWDSCKHINSTGNFIDPYLGEKCKTCTCNPKYKNNYEAKERRMRMDFIHTKEL